MAKIIEKWIEKERAEMSEIKTTPDINPKSAWMNRGTALDTSDKLYQLGKKKQMKRNIQTPKLHESEFLEAPKINEKSRNMVGSWTFSHEDLYQEAKAREMRSKQW